MQSNNTLYTSIYFPNLIAIDFLPLKLQNQTKKLTFNNETDET